MRPAPLRFKDVVITYDVGPGLRARYLKDRWSLRGPHLVFLAGIPVSVIMPFVITYIQCNIFTDECLYSVITVLAIVSLCRFLFSTHKLLTCRAAISQGRLS